MKTFFLLILSLTGFLISLPAQQTVHPKHVENQLLVQLAAGQTMEQVMPQAKKSGIASYQVISQRLRVYLLTYDETKTKAEDMMGGKYPKKPLGFVKRIRRNLLTQR